MNRIEYIEENIERRHMTEKAQAILQKIKLRKLIPSRGPQSASEPVSDSGGGQGMAVLNDINQHESDHDEFVKSLAPTVNVL